MELKLRRVLGLFLILVNFPVFIFIFGWSTLVDPKFEDWSPDWWRTVLSQMYRVSGSLPFLAFAGLVIGILLLCVPRIWSMAGGRHKKLDDWIDEIHP